MHEHATPAGAPAMWHLSWQAAAGREFFPPASLYVRIRKRLIGAHKGKGRVLVDYALLPTEIHVVAEIAPPDTTGGVARAIGNVVTRWVNAAQGVRSPLLAGRYRAHRIESAAEQREQARMLAWRPVFFRLCKTPAHYRHSAYRIALGLTPPDGFDTSPLLRVFGMSVLQSRAALRTWAGKRPTEQQRQVWELTRGLIQTAGSGSRQQSASATALPGLHDAAAALVAAGCHEPDGRIRSGALRGARGGLALLDVWVAAKLGLRDARELHASANAVGARGRGLVGCLAETHELCAAAEVARHFHRARSTLSEHMKARRACAADRQVLATPVERIIEEAVALRRL